MSRMMGLSRRSQKCVYAISLTLLELILCPQGKKKAPVYTANLEKTAHIQALRDKWMCMRSEAACGSTYCYVDPGSGDHIPLSHEAIDTWAMGMVSVILIFPTHSGSD